VSRWFRFYDDALNDPKVQKLPSDMFKAWVNLLCIASKNDGSIPRDDVQFLLRVTEKCAAGIIDYLLEHKLLDDRGDVVTPHNWDGRQFKSDVSNERVKRHRDRKRNDECNVTDAVTVTPPEQSRTDTDTNTKKKEARAKPACSPEFEEFWKGYPKTPVMSKKQAWVEWEKLSPEDQSAALSAVAPYREWLAKQKDHPVVHACRFLSQRRFEGFAQGDLTSTPGNAVPNELVVQLYQKNGRWHRDFGPEPGKPGCRVPLDVLQKFGLGNA
jgi:hypothetical protein